MLSIDVCPVGVVVCHGDASCLFAHHDCQSIGVLGDASRSSVSQTELLGYVQVVADGQDTRCGYDLVFLHNHRTVVQG